MSKTITLVLSVVTAAVLLLGIALAVPSATVTEEAADRYQDTAFAEEE